MERLLPFFVDARPNESGLVVLVLQIGCALLNGAAAGITIAIATLIVKAVV